MRKFERDEQNRIQCDDLDKRELRKFAARSIMRPENFGYGGDRDDMFVKWALGPVIEHRDSDALDRSNAQALRTFLKSDPSLDDDWECDKASHWAVGWVAHLSFRVFEVDGSITRIARILCAWFDYLKNQHPVADEDLMSQMEDEDAQQTWKNCYNDQDRIEYIRKHRSQFEFHNFADLLGCVRGKYFAGYASELLS